MNPKQRKVMDSFIDEYKAPTNRVELLQHVPLISTIFLPLILWGAGLVLLTAVLIAGTLTTVIEGLSVGALVFVLIMMMRSAVVDGLGAILHHIQAGYLIGRITARQEIFESIQQSIKERELVASEPPQTSTDIKDNSSAAN